MLYISLAIIQIVFFEANFLVYRTIRDIFSFTGEPLLVLKIIFVILSISFIATSALAHAFKNKIVKIIYTAAAIWFGFLMYFLLASALYWIVVIFGGKEISNSESAFAGMIFFAGATLTGIWGMINASRIRIKRIALYIPNMPKVWKNRKAVLISDMHLGQIRGKSFALKITNIIKWLSQDIVFLAGDTFDGVMVNMDECLAPFSEIKASLGIFSVIGNHEEFKEDSARKYISAMQKNGIKTLEN